MADLGTVVGSEISTNRDSDENVTLLQCIISEEEDIQNVELYTRGGDDYRPPDDSTVIIVSIGKSWKVAIACEDGVEPAEKEKGERRIYSTDNGGPVKATIWLKKDGTIELNGSDDFVVSFDDLQTALDDFESQVSDELDKIATAISGLGGSYTPGALSLDISAAKVETVKVP